MTKPHHPQFKLRDSKDIRLKATDKPLGWHSSRVRILRKIIPLSGLGLIILVIAWPISKQFFDKQFDDIPLVSKKMILENRLINPQIVDSDDKNQPYKIAAESSIQVQNNQSELVKPHGEITAHENTNYEISSDQGHYDQEKKVITYENNVVLTTSQGYEFKTPKAWLHLKTYIAEGNDPVVGVGPAGQIEASDGFMLDKDAKLLYFKGKTKLILKDDQKSKP